MRLTKEQLHDLSVYEDYFRTAIDQRWAPYPGQTAIKEIEAAYKAATGDRRRINYGCGVCLLHLLQDCGRIYFADKAELAAEKKRRKKA